MATTINSNTTDGLVITPDTSGEINLQANGVTKAKVTANGLQDANGASIRGGSFRNLIINGDMSIAQRGTSATGLQNTPNYLIDRMSYRRGGVWTTATFSHTQDTDVPTGQGFSKSLKFSCTATETPSTTQLAYFLGIYNEGKNFQHLKYGTSSAETITLSFWVKSNVTGTYAVNLYASGTNDRAIYKTYTINSANTWEKKTLTIEPNTTTTIANDNSNGFHILWVGASGPDNATDTVTGSWETSLSTKSANLHGVNLASSTSNYVNITGVQLEVGEGASDFEFLPYDVQLARCQMYYKNIFHGQFCGVVYEPNGDTRTTVLQIGTMRASPTITPSSYSAHSLNLGPSGALVNTPTATWNLTVGHAGNNFYYLDTNQSGSVSYTNTGNNVVVGVHGAGTILCDAEL